MKKAAFAPNIALNGAWTEINKYSYVFQYFVSKLIRSCAGRELFLTVQKKIRTIGIAQYLNRGK